jgi:hypothetical protein
MIGKKKATAIGGQRQLRGGQFVVRLPNDADMYSCRLLGDTVRGER